MAKRWKQRPDGSTWGDWGGDDELGRINLLTPEKVLEGVREVEAGVSFCLSLPLDYPGGSALTPRRHPPTPIEPAAAPRRSSPPPRTWTARPTSSSTSTRARWRSGATRSSSTCGL